MSARIDAIRVFRLLTGSLVVCTAVSACTPSIASAPTASPTGPQSSTEHAVTLAVGEEKTPVGGVSIKFVGVTDDSRCPTDVTCVWAGDATVRLEARSGRTGPTGLLLHTANERGQTARFDRFMVRLVRLTPEPASGRPVASSDYRVELSLTEDRP